MERVPKRLLSMDVFEELARGNTPIEEFIFQMSLVKDVPFVRLDDKEYLCA